MGRVLGRLSCGFPTPRRLKPDHCPLRLPSDSPAVVIFGRKGFNPNNKPTNIISDNGSDTVMSSCVKFIHSALATIVSLTSDITRTGFRSTTKRKYCRHA